VGAHRLEIPAAEAEFCEFVMDNSGVRIIR
jgi:hypothetical protein